MKLILLSLLLLLNTNSLQAKSKTKGEIKETKDNYLIVGTPSLTGFKDSFIQLQAGKIAVNVLAKSKKYLLMFTAQNTVGKDIQFKRLEMNIAQRGKVYDLKIAINKVGKKTVEIKSVSERSIEKRFLLLQIRKSMYELLFGEEYLKKMKNKVKRENQRDKKELRSLLRKGRAPKKVSAALAQIISDIKLSQLKVRGRKKVYNEEFAKKIAAEKQLRSFKGGIQRLSLIHI